MTAYGVMQALAARSEAATRQAYRTAVYHRMSHKHLPKNEAAIFAKAKPKKQSLGDQYKMARLMTSMMSKEKH